MSQKRWFKLICGKCLTTHEDATTLSESMGSTRMICACGSDKFFFMRDSEGLVSTDTTTDDEKRESLEGIEEHIGELLSQYRSECAQFGDAGPGQLEGISRQIGRARLLRKALRMPIINYTTRH